MKICHTLWIMNSKEESFVEVWKVVVDKLDYDMLHLMRYKIMFYFTQLREFESASKHYLKRIDELCRIAVRKAPYVAEWYLNPKILFLVPNATSSARCR